MFKTYDKTSSIDGLRIATFSSDLVPITIKSHVLVVWKSGLLVFDVMSSGSPNSLDDDPKLEVLTVVIESLFTDFLIDMHFLG